MVGISGGVWHVGDRIGWWHRAEVAGGDDCCTTVVGEGGVRDWEVRACKLQGAQGGDFQSVGVRKVLRAPKAIFFPLLVATGDVPLNRELWTDGYFSIIVEIVGGVWLRWWLQVAAAMSNMEMFVAEMSSDSFQLLGMAERGMLLEFFGKRSCYETPYT
ncbi:hypothetical protein JHK84_040529 [Glycine max]|nr:hypothetical protein JHK84_040529 [Glycine max]